MSCLVRRLAAGCRRASLKVTMFASLSSRVYDSDLLDFCSSVLAVLIPSDCATTSAWQLVSGVALLACKPPIMEVGRVSVRVKPAETVLLNKSFWVYFRIRGVLKFVVQQQSGALKSRGSYPRLLCSCSPVRRSQRAASDDTCALKLRAIDIKLCGAPNFPNGN